MKSIEGTKKIHRGDQCNAHRGPMKSIGVTNEIHRRLGIKSTGGTK